MRVRRADQPHAEPAEQPDRGGDHAGTGGSRPPSRGSRTPGTARCWPAGAAIRRAAAAPRGCRPARRACAARCRRRPALPPVSWSTTSTTYSTPVNTSIVNSARIGAAGSTRAIERRDAGAERPCHRGYGARAAEGILFSRRRHVDCPLATSGKPDAPGRLAAQAQRWPSMPSAASSRLAGVGAGGQVLPAGVGHDEDDVGRLARPGRLLGRRPARRAGCRRWRCRRRCPPARRAAGCGAARRGSRRE